MEQNKTAADAKTAKPTFSYKKLVEMTSEEKRNEMMECVIEVITAPEKVNKIQVGNYFTAKIVVGTGANELKFQLDRNDFQSVDAKLFFLERKVISPNTIERKKGLCRFIHGKNVDGTDYVFLQAILSSSLARTVMLSYKERLLIEVGAKQGLYKDIVFIEMPTGEKLEDGAISKTSDGLLAE